jgi:hypothetical protein
MIKKNKTNKKINKLNKLNKIKKNTKSNTKSYTKSNTKKNTTKKTHKLHKQHGASFMNNITGNIFTNTEENSQSFAQKDIITIIYNRDTPKTIMINNTSPNNVYQSTLVQSVPHIQMKDYDNHYLLVIILPGMKPQLLWAIEIQSGSKSKSILDYTLPKLKVGSRFKIIFKLHKYHKNIKETFKVGNNMPKERYTVFNELKDYLTKNNMLQAFFFKEVNIVQDKGQDITQFLSFLAK